MFAFEAKRLARTAPGTGFPPASSVAHPALHSTLGNQTVQRLLIASGLRPIPAGQVIQRQEICVGGVYDEERKVCRPLEAGDVVPEVPASDPVDAGFWLSAPRVRAGSVPILDNESTGVIIGFRYSSSGYWEVYDLHGNLVDVGESPLETPLIDPIDIVAGGIVGLGRGILGGGLRGAARGIAGGAGRGAGSGLGRAGLAVAIRALSQRAATALRATYRVLRFRGNLSFTATTAARMADPARRVPHHILKLAIRHGSRSPDPQGAAGAFQYLIPMFRNGRGYTLKVVLREADQTVLHFHYY